MNITNDKLINYLCSIKDEKYQKFHQKLLKNDNIKLIGVKTPILKQIAKYISQNDYETFIQNNKHEFYEETLIHGLILGYLKIDFNDLLEKINNFIPYIDNWATCDLTASNLKQFKKKQKEGFNYIKKCLKSHNMWQQRLGVVLLNDYYINDIYINKVIETISNLETDQYYLQMAIAWTLSTCYIKYPNITIDIIKKQILSSSIQNKTIQKIIESTRISKEEKEYLKQFKI